PRSLPHSTPSCRSWFPGPVFGFTTPSRTCLPPELTARRPRARLHPQFFSPETVVARKVLDHWPAAAFCFVAISLSICIPFSFWPRLISLRAITTLTSSRYTNEGCSRRTRSPHSISHLATSALSRLLQLFGDL